MNREKLNPHLRFGRFRKVKNQNELTQQHQISLISSNPPTTHFFSISRRYTTHVCACILMDMGRNVESFR